MKGRKCSLLLKREAVSFPSVIFLFLGGLVEVNGRELVKNKQPP